MSQSATLPRHMRVDSSAATQQEASGGGLRRGLASSDRQILRLRQAIGRRARYQFDVCLLANDPQIKEVQSLIERHFASTADQAEGTLEVRERGGITVYIAARAKAACVVLMVIDPGSLNYKKYNELLNRVTDDYRPCGRGLCPIVQKDIEEILSS